MFCYPQVWTYYPALFYGLSFLIGIGFAISHAWWIGLPAIALWIPIIGYIRSYKEEPLYFRIILGLICAILGYFLYSAKFDLPKVPPAGVHGEGVLEIDQISTKSHFFGKSWQYRGNLRVFNAEGSSIGHNIPVFVTIPFKKDLKHPPADSSYVVAGRLKQSLKGSYVLALNHDVPWKKVQGSWSLSELRYNAKKKVKSYVERHIKASRSAKFLTGMATGEFDDRLMAFEFSRFGLQHLMAISGFHFGIIAYFLSLAVRMVLPIKWTPWALIAGLTAYFVFLGMTASVMRSWIGAMIFFAGQILQKESNGLNALGIGLLIILAIDPLAASQMGFQFSFATTAAILVFYSPFLASLDDIWPRRGLSNMTQMGLWSQHGYVILNFFKSALALTMAVSIVAIPMTIYFFNKFPVLSLFYNLFYPFLASFSMFLLMFAIVLAWIPPLSSLIHALNTLYTEFVLDFTYGIPTHFDLYIKYYGMHPGLLVGYVSVIYFFGLAWKYAKKEELSWYAPLP